MKRLMTHMVAGSPNLATTKRMIKQMAQREIAAVELQIPFSDPIADGPVLMEANDEAVRQGVSAGDTFRLIESVDLEGTKVYIMSYLQPILQYGSEKFFKRALKSGCSGFIIPDLPFDALDVRRLISRQPELQRALVPVLSPGMSLERLKALFSALKPELVYLTARQGITGEHSELSDELSGTIKTVREYTLAEIAVGFGVQTQVDVRSVLKSGADLAVVGSALAGALKQSEKKAEDLLDKLCAAS